MRRVILAICATAAALVLLLTFKTHTQSAIATPAAALGSPAPGTGAASPAASAASPGASAAASGAATRSAAAKSGAAETVTGAAWPTIYGPVQVRITVTNGKITAAAALVYPEETPRDSQINAYAIPQLNKEAVAAGNANIATVSGATYTSGGYLGSLQNALDKAGA